MKLENHSHKILSLDEEIFCKLEFGPFHIEAKRKNKFKENKQSFFFELN